jgi:hypothetical protein
MLRSLDLLLASPISMKVHESVMGLQYADDTVIVANADVTTLVSVCLILCLFTKVSDLNINLTKSCFIPFNVQEDDISENNIQLPKPVT